MNYNKLYAYLAEANMMAFYKEALNTNESRNLPYHNSNHMESVAALAYEGCEFYSIGGDILKCVIGASLLHDYNHSGGKFKDDTQNVEIALENMVRITTNYPELFINDDIKIMYHIIKSTKYPYDTNMDMDILPLYVKIVLDADIIQSFLYKPYTSILRGLSEEMDITFDRFIETQDSFIDNLKPHTDWGVSIMNSRKDEIKEIINFFK